MWWCVKCAERSSIRCKAILFHSLANFIVRRTYTVSYSYIVCGSCMVHVASILVRLFCHLVCLCWNNLLWKLARGPLAFTICFTTVLGMVIETLHKYSIVPNLKQEHWMTPKGAWKLTLSKATHLCIACISSPKFHSIFILQPSSGYRPLCGQCTELPKHDLEHHKAKLRYPK